MDLTIQAETFAILALTGILLGFLFDFYRVLRGMYKPRSLMTGLNDLIYWLLATLIAGGALLYSNWGEMRLYVLIALVAGAGGYFRLLSRYAVRFIIQIIRFITLSLRWLKLTVYYLVIKPISYPVHLLSIPFVYLARAMKRLNRFFENRKEEPPV